MILVNRNFGNPVLAEVIGDMFNSNSNTDIYIDPVTHNNTLAAGSSLVTSVTNEVLYTDGSTGGTYTARPAAENTYPYYEKSLNKNFSIVTEHFLKVLDKVYTKIWNESFTETGIYYPQTISTIYNGLVTIPTEKVFRKTTNIAFNVEDNIMSFKKFVDRCITAGILLEEDRLQTEDQTFLSNLNKLDLSTQIDLDAKSIIFTASKPIDIAPDLNALTGQYLAGKKLYLLMTPYLQNECTIKNINYNSKTTPIVEPFYNYEIINGTDSSMTASFPNTKINSAVRRPIAFFKPKTDASKFGRSLPLATHLIWSIGTPESKAAAELAGTPVPDLVFDHLDRISHIDSLVLKIKFDKLQF